ncbi:MAG: chemotaxis-specific protein-glutamate methyltransferase CheB [Erythrobacter sp.]|uniref:chemotaxis-specific protein-glutamate methyltransferase CheB n=1 Tax=Marinobacter alexandrii TaxID=2570351 RepID=UPI003297FF1F
MTAKKTDAHSPSQTDQSGQSLPEEREDIRVMIVDDSLTVRTIFKRMVESRPGMAVVGTAGSGERAIAQLQSTPADVVLLDLEMPGMGGLEALPEILRAAENAQVLVVSSLTDDGAEHTVAALSMGAADTMLKPRPGGFNDDYRELLLDKISALGGAESDSQESDEQPAAASPKSGSIPCGKRPQILAIGASTGGIHALNLLLKNLPPEFDLPILITQHLPASFVPVFARQIEMTCARGTLIAEDGTVVGRGEVAIATGHGHMIVKRRGEQLKMGISTSPARSGCLPSVDPMLSSMAEAYEGRALAIILSGMGRDGLEGAKDLSAAGGTIFAQDAESSAVWGMPGAVSKAGLVSTIAPPEELAKAVLAIADPKSVDAPAWK